jgi:glycosyltransferase involved in cell wall biosynthesis
MKKINYFGPICGTGYGVTTINILKQLNKNYDVTVFPISSSVTVETKDDYDLIMPLLDKTKPFDKSATCIKVWHQFDLASRIGNGKYIAFPIFELDTFNTQEISHLNSVDHLLVCSNWAKNILISNNVSVPISVVPLGFDPTIFNESISFDENYTNNNYVFLTIGKWEKRKGHDVLIDCFNKAFNNDDNVELWMVTENPFLSNEEANYWHNLVLSSKLKSKIKIFNRLQTQFDVANIIKHSDCGVYVSRAEGWNLELLESIAMNKPVIATNYSGHTEFCNDKNSYLVNIDELEPAVDNKWFFGNGNWARLGDSQIDQIITHMRYMYNNKIKNNAGSEYTKQKFTWENSAKIISECI